MKCYNRNTKEYQNILKRHKSPLMVDLLIDEWQTINNSEDIPTPKQLDQLNKGKNLQFSLKKRDFKDTILRNLREKGYIHMRNKKWWVVSNRQLGYNKYEFDPVIYRNNLESIKAFMRLWNIPKDAMLIEFGTRRKYRAYSPYHAHLNAAEMIQYAIVDIDTDVLTRKDLLEENRDDSSTHINMILGHLQRVFPQVGIDQVTPGEAKAHYKSLPASQQKVPFSQVKSYIYQGRAKIIKGRVTIETAVEEVLHPLVNALYADNPTLFKALFKEAQNNYSNLGLEIMDAYTDDRGFTSADRQKELVTQALARHFAKEFETKPTQTWKAKIQELLQWLLKHISNIYQYVSQKKLILYAGMIEPTTTLSDIAKILNTKDLQFNLKQAHIHNEGKIQFKLSPETQAYYNQIKETGFEAQEQTIQNAFRQIRKDEREQSVLAANSLDGTDTPVVILDQGVAGEKHIYRDINDLDANFESVTSLIGGEFVKEYPIKAGETLKDIMNNHGKSLEELAFANKISVENLKKLENQKGEKLKYIQIPRDNEFTINREIGNDFDNILEGLTLQLPWEQVKKIIEDKAAKKGEKPFGRVSEKLASEFYNENKGRLWSLYGEQTVLIPQVTIGGVVDTVDQDGKPIKRYVAGTIDILAVNTDGSVFPIDLKTSWNSISDPSYKDKAYPVGPGSVFYDASKPQVLQIPLTKKMKHSMQVNLYRRLLENAGYDVYGQNTNAANNPVTLHYKITLNKDQTEIIGFNYDGTETHVPDEFAGKVDQILPLRVDIKAKKQLREKNNPIADETEYQEERTIEEEEIIASSTYQAIFEVVSSFQQNLISRRKAVEKLKNSMKLMNEKNVEIDKIDFTLSAITLAMRDAKVDVLYTEILRDVIEQVEVFENYVDPTKQNSIEPEFISKVMNFQNLLEGFEGLTKLTENEGLSPEQLKLKDKLQTKLTKIGNGPDSLINLAIDDYVRSLVRGESSRDFDNQDLDILMDRAEDIGMAIFYTGDMATQRDTILALMDKIYKRQKQKVLDAILIRNSEIRRLAVKLEKLSGKKVDFKFMLVYDEHGKFTGRYVQKIGNEYYDKLQKLRDELTDVNGEWKQYTYHPDVSDYTQEQLERNKEIHAARSALREYMQPEKIVEGAPEDGDNHRYNQDFKNARSKYQTFRPYKGGNFGVWVKKDGISKEEYQQFLMKYYDSVDYDRSIYDNDGNFTGMVQPDSKYFPKRDFVEIIEKDEIIDPKYRKLMMTDPGQMTELEKTQKEFYEMYIKFFENDLLQKLPPTVRDQMLGRVPTIKDNFYNDMKKKGPFFVRLWGKMTRSVKNFFQTTSISRKVSTDDKGRILDSLPIYFVGKPMTEQQLAEIENEINTLDAEYKALNDPKPKDDDAYRNKRKELIEQRMMLQTRPTVNELQTDLADSLMRFSAMAENYEIMGAIEDTLHAMLKVVKQRQYTPASGDILKSVVGGVQKIVGRRADDDLEDPLIVQRAKKWMKMVYYDNDKVTKNWFDKFTDGIISYTSLTYVGFNPFGNFNNYAVGRLSNLIETSGGMYYKSSTAFRATSEFNKRAIPDFMRAIGHRTYVGEQMGFSDPEYADYEPKSKWEGLVEYFRMMDAASDIRETHKNVGKEGLWERAKGWGYMIQDAAEYNVQTKVGNAILMSYRAIQLNEEGQEIGDISLYDALEFNPETGETKMKDGYTHIKRFRNGQIQDKLIEWNDNARFDVRNYIREVNKQIHGNYAYEDRTIMQTMALGKLAMQFHKWVAPTFKARFRPEYYDENLGWVEGRYITGWSFLKYATTHLTDGRNILRNWKELQGSKGDNRVRNLKRNLGDIGVILISIALKMMLVGLLKGDDDEDESRIRRRIENALIYQADRQRQEFLMFWPGLGTSELFKLSKSPFSSLRTMEELTEALAVTASTIKLGITLDKDEFLADKRVVYQRGSRAGQWKIDKNWKDAIPLLYSFEKWKKYQDQKDFHVK
tara:strand:+ start:2120 stop:8017 length:5898 start_codon:yes stop_codon:yes gene_type:complete